ncbi:MAG: DMT family transporter [Acidimicrobiia bacterium]
MIAATLGWASSAVMTRAVLVNGVGSFTLVPLRMSFALVSLLLIVAVSRKFWTTSKAAWGRGVVLGLVAMALPMLLLTLALEDLPVSLGSLLIALIPIATIAAAHFMLEDERFSPKSLPGLLLALAGSAVLVGIGGESIAGVDNLWRGVAFSLAGVALAGVGGALSRRFALQVPAEDLVLPQFTVNTALLLSIVPLITDIDVVGVSGESWVLLAAIGVIGTTVPFASFLIAAGINSAYRLGLTGYTVPVVAVTLAVIFLGERLTVPVVVGAVLIVAGVVLAERTTHHVPSPGVFESR